ASSSDSLSSWSAISSIVAIYLSFVLGCGHPGSRHARTPPRSPAAIVTSPDQRRDHHRAPCPPQYPYRFINRVARIATTGPPFAHSASRLRCATPVRFRRGSPVLVQDVDELAVRRRQQSDQLGRGPLQRGHQVATQRLPRRQVGQRLEASRLQYLT